MAPELALQQKVIQQKKCEEAVSGSNLTERVQILELKKKWQKAGRKMTF